jgi:hypothetical protein
MLWSSPCYSASGGYINVIEQNAGTNTYAVSFLLENDFIQELLLLTQ